MNRWLGQLWLLIKTNFLLRRRHPVLFALELFWPALVVSILFLLRFIASPGEKTCDPEPIALPSAGFLSFLHSMVCRPKCTNASNAKRQSPAKVNRVLHNMEPYIRSGQSRLLKAVPGTFELLNSLNEATDDPKFRKILEQQLTIGDFLKDRNRFKEHFVFERKLLSNTVMEALIKSTINLQQLFLLENVEDLRTLECNPVLLSKFVSVPTESPTGIAQITAELCNSKILSGEANQRKILSEFSFAEALRVISQVPSLLSDVSTKKSLHDIALMLDSYDRVRSSSKVAQVETLFVEMSDTLPALWRLLAFTKSSEKNIQLLSQVMQDWRQIAGESTPNKQQWKTLNQGIKLSQQILDWYSYSFNNNQKRRRRTKRQGLKQARDSNKKTLPEFMGMVRNLASQLRKQLSPTSVTTLQRSLREPKKFAEWAQTEVKLSNNTVDLLMSSRIRTKVMLDPWSICTKYFETQDSQWVVNATIKEKAILNMALCQAPYYPFVLQYWSVGIDRAKLLPSVQDDAIQMDKNEDWKRFQDDFEFLRKNMHQARRIWPSIERDIILPYGMSERLSQVKPTEVPKASSIAWYLASTTAPVVASSTLNTYDIPSVTSTIQPPSTNSYLPFPTPGEFGFTEIPGTFPMPSTENLPGEKVIFDVVDYVMTNLPRNQNDEIDWQGVLSQVQLLLSAQNLTGKDVEPRNQRSTRFKQKNNRRENLIKTCISIAQTVPGPVSLRNQLALTNVTTDQLKKYPIYKRVICNMSHMSIAAFHNALMQELGWIKSLENIRQFHKLSNLSETCRAFVDSGGPMVHWANKVRVELNGPWGQEVKSCVSEPGFYNTLYTYLQLIQDLSKLAEDSDGKMISKSFEEYIAELTEMSQDPKWNVMTTTSARFFETMNKVRNNWPKEPSQQLNTLLYSRDVDELLEDGQDFINELLYSAGNSFEMTWFSKGINGLRNLKEVLYQTLNSGIQIKDVSSPALKHFMTEQLNIELKDLNGLEIVPSHLVLAQQLPHGLYCSHSLMKEWIFRGDQRTKEIFAQKLCETEKYHEFINFVLDSYGYRKILKSYMTYGITNRLEVSGLGKADSEYAAKRLHQLPHLISQAAHQMSMFSEDDNLGDDGTQTNSTWSTLKIIQSSFCADEESIQMPKSIDWFKIKVPTCEEMLQDVSDMEQHVLKKLLEGEIAVSPDNMITRSLIEAANRTFVEMDQWLQFVSAASEADKITDQLTMEKAVKLKQLLSNPFMHGFLSAAVDLDSYQLLNVIESTKTIDLENANRLAQLMKVVYGYLKCFKVDRFKFYSNEQDLEHRIIKSEQPLLAAVIFQHTEKNKRSIPETWFQSSKVPERLNYTIRMDTVPSTAYKLRGIHQLYFYRGMSEYLLGFVQIQDMIDSAFVSLWEPNKEPLKAFAQQLPMPTKHYDWFPDYLKYWLPNTMMAAWVLLVGLHVRMNLYETETGLAEVLQVTGLKPGVRWFAWFCTGLIIWFFAISLVIILLKAGLILANIDWTILLVLFIIFAVSMLSLSNLICAVCSKANFGTFIMVVVYLTSFLPFLVISMDEHQTTYPAWIKILTGLSAPSALAWTCRPLSSWEDYGGLKWSLINVKNKNTGNANLPPEQVTVGACMIMMLIDSVVYSLLAVAYILIKRRLTSSRVVKNIEDTYSTMSTRTSFFEQDTDHPIGLTARNLTKFYGKSEKAAISALDLDLFQSHVTCLLGTNGAGKTTTINVLTGITKPSSGVISVVGAKKTVGFCPQHNTLFDRLTVQEHLDLYSRIKGHLSAAHHKVDIENLLFQTGLQKSANKLACHLSGGMRRRLCVALAFIGDSSFVILDEPTAGIDPVARRSIWEIINKNKKNRTILLCTHYLDEAELLADQVAILSQGKLMCSGSPSFLQENMDDGVRIKICRRDPFTCPTRRLLETASKVNLQSIRIIKESAAEVVFAVQASSDEMIMLIESLEEERIKNCLKIDNISLAYVTLEEMFLEITKKDRKSDAEEPEQMKNFKSSSLQPDMSDMDLIQHTKSKYQYGKARHKMQQVYALLLKRLYHCHRNKRLIFGALCLPILFVFIAMALGTLKPANDAQEPLLLSPAFYTPNEAFYTDGKYLRMIENWCLKNNCGDLKLENMVSYADNLTSHLSETYLGHKQYRLGGWSSHDENSVTIWHELNSLHILPIYLGMARNMELKSLGIPYNIRTYTKPIKFRNEDLLFSKFADIGISLILLCAYSFVLAALVVIVVNERIRKERCLQRLTGVGPLLYWSSSLFCDMICYNVVVLVASLIISIFGSSVYGAGLNLLMTILLALLFGLAMFPVLYLVQEQFSDSTSVYIVVFSVSVLLGVGPVTCISFFDVFSWMKQWVTIGKTLKSIFLIFPPYCFTSGLIDMAQEQLKLDMVYGFTGVSNSYRNPLLTVSPQCLSLIVIALVFFIIRVLLDIFHHRSITSWTPPLIADNQLERDIIAERCRIHSCLDVLRIFDLCKKYRSGLGTSTAVDGVSFGVQTAECFGLIGLNGAGKTSIFEILASNQRQTNGAVFLYGDSLSSSNVHCRLSYCPQENACDPMLTGREWLTLSALSQGYKSSSANVLASSWLNRLELVNWADKPIHTYSGGTKRKLCLAASLIGDADVVLLDEPTAGMDPSSRRLVWAHIRTAVAQGRSILFTSHCMSECETVCDRIALMVNGQLKALGSKEHLKHRFASSMIISIRTETPSLCDLTLKELRTKLSSSLVDCQRDGSSAQLRINDNNIQLGSLLRILNGLKKKIPNFVYSVSQGTLEEAFMRFASKQCDTISVKNR